jgi:hypothetical protein
VRSLNLYLLSLLLACGCATQGTLHIGIRDETGGAIPGALVKVEGAQAISGRDGVATFHLKANRYQVDAEIPGMLSCGPKSVTVRGGRASTVSLDMRVGTIRDGVVIGTTPAESGSYSEVAYGPCPGIPGSERVITTSRPRRLP